MELDNQAVWHPFTPMRQWQGDSNELGRVIVDGDGFELIDAQGRRFIDGFASLWCNLHGHRVPAIDDAIRKQLEHIAHTTMLGHTSVPAIRLAEKLVEISPAGLDKVFYSDSGATAVEVAMKMAYQYYYNRGEGTRSRFIAIRNSYHGDTIGSVSLGGIGLFHRIFKPLLFEAHFVDSPCEFYHPAGEKAMDVSLGQMRSLLEDYRGEVCAVILEPLMQGAAGMLKHPEGYLRAVRELTHEFGVKLIVDEVATGFCSTGKMFACDHEDVSPDLLCLGKKITGGYLPIAATLATQDIFDAFCGEIDEGKTFYHGHTYTGNALGCAAAVAALELIDETNLLDALPAKVDLITTKLDAVREHPNVGDIRQVGLMTGIELVASDARAFDPASRTGAAICLAARQHGIIIRPLGDVIVLMPAPAMDLATLERLLDATIQTIVDYFA
ncbi:MAG: adenosylmethionine--8-amino-7-oxononanoate transaminase [Phycisphaerales bacterium]|nr:adenosylmethionine--8-amino-7-oxononanoate transaminase [Phycisphaerales bacterium]MBT7171345.1 adenosylmethionine--8-amino-7-oxononanoate transaminase [Phycisphaerales bacterium]